MEYATHKKTLLIVDDEPEILAVVSAMLGDERYKVLTATSGSAGLEQSREFEGDIDLLLSDFQMPGMSGTDLANAMIAERPHLRVLLMSGFPDGTLVLSEGWHFLLKPFVASQLRALVVGLVFPNKPCTFLTRDNVLRMPNVQSE